MPRIAITPGEPAGIGPDLCALLSSTVFPCELVLYADPELLMSRADQLGIRLQLKPVDFSTPPSIPTPGQLSVQAVNLKQSVIAGKLDVENASYVLETLTLATQACTSGLCQALCTGPVHKSIINQAGIAFSGHTEFLGELTGGTPVMMLASPTMRVALVTTHIALRDVANQVTPARLKTVLSILNDNLRTRFGIADPRIMVCGLNPHAGEDGHLGTEEIEIIKPTLEQLKQQGMTLIGPLPADTVFTAHHLQNCDAVLAMYHDQGLPPLKQTGFGKAVNITLGLPIIRISVDHGTALDLAATGNIDTGSYQLAIELAIKMANHNV
ncbi:MAG: 4-hydroxythreonine-4-phosphate dehydrogenase PdxA [Methylococcales bacterium]